MPDGYYIMGETEAGAYIDRVLREKFPDAYRQPDPASAQRPADSVEQIVADYPDLFGSTKSENT